MPQQLGNPNEAANRRFEFDKRSQLFIARTAKRFPSPRYASAIQIIRPSQSTADTSPNSSRLY